VITKLGGFLGLELLFILFAINVRNDTNEPLGAIIKPGGKRFNPSSLHCCFTQHVYEIKNLKDTKCNP